jgi:hypothetical protein
MSRSKKKLSVLAKNDDVWQGLSEGPTTISEAIAWHISKLSTNAAVTFMVIVGPIFGGLLIVWRSRTDLTLLIGVGFLAIGLLFGLIWKLRYRRLTLWHDQRKAGKPPD